MTNETKQFTNTKRYRLKNKKNQIEKNQKIYKTENHDVD